MKCVGRRDRCTLKQVGGTFFLSGAISVFIKSSEGHTKFLKKKRFMYYEYLWVKCLLDFFHHIALWFFRLTPGMIIWFFFSFSSLNKHNNSPQFACNCLLGIFFLSIRHNSPGLTSEWIGKVSKQLKQQQKCLFPFLGKHTHPRQSCSNSGDINGIYTQVKTCCSQSVTFTHAFVKPWLA